MALTANRELSRYVDQELRSFPVADAEHIFKGALVGIQRTTGLARNLVAGDLFAGVAYEEMDNSRGPAGAESVRLYTQGDFVLAVHSATEAWAGAPVYAADNETTTVLPAEGGSYCGILMAILGDGEGVVRIQPLASPQVEQAANVPLESSLSGATTNPVLIAQRALKILSASVSFNTVPNQGLLDVGYDNSDPDEIVDAFNLATLTAHTPAALFLASRDVPRGKRVWAKVGQASTTAGVGGVLSLRYIELP